MCRFRGPSRCGSVAKKAAITPPGSWTVEAPASGWNSPSTPTRSASRSMRWSITRSPTPPPRTPGSISPGWGRPPPCRSTPMGPWQGRSIRPCLCRSTGWGPRTRWGSRAAWTRSGSTPATSAGRRSRRCTTTPGVEDRMSRLLIAGILGLLGPLTQDDPLPVPSDEALAQAEKTIREVFREEYGVRTGTAELKLAKKFVEQGLQTREDPALKYVLLREAGELALAAGDMETLIAALDQLCSLFAVSAVPLRQGFLGRAEPRLTKPEDFKRLADAELRLVPDYLEQDLFDLAGATAQSALSAAKKSKDIPLISRADTALRSSSDQKAAFEKARKADKDLEANPQDPVANAVRGEYWCLHRGRWDQGLECLAKGGDLGLKTLAQKELARPTDAGPLVELADGWWDLSEKEKSPLKKRHLSVHAASLYERALPLTEGLTKVRIENRMAAVAPASGTTAAKVHREGLIA